MLDAAALADRVKASPKLTSLHDSFVREVQFCGDNNIGIDPITIIMLLSIVVQVIIHCRKKRTDDEILNTIRELRTYPPRRLLRLKRRVNRLWADYLDSRDLPAFTGNPLWPALYEVAESADPAALQELIQFARAQAQE